jgi:hypothetical protein
VQYIVRVLRNLHESAEHGKRIPRSNTFAHRRGNPLDSIDNRPRPNRPRANTKTDTPLAQSSLAMGGSQSTTQDDSQQPLFDTTGRTGTRIPESNDTTVRPQSQTKAKFQDAAQNIVEQTRGQQKDWESTTDTQADSSFENSRSGPEDVDDSGVVDGDGAGVSESESDMSEDTARKLADTISEGRKYYDQRRQYEEQKYYDQRGQYEEHNARWHSTSGVRAEGPYLRKLNRQFSCLAYRYKILDVVGGKSSWDTTVLKPSINRY